MKTVTIAERADKVRYVRDFSEGSEPSEFGFARVVMPHDAPTGEYVRADVARELAAQLERLVNWVDVNVAAWDVAPMIEDSRAALAAAR